MNYQPLDCSDLVEICEGIHDEDVVYEKGKECPDCEAEMSLLGLEDEKI